MKTIIPPAISAALLLVASSAHAVTLAPSADAFVHFGNGSDDNFGNSNILYIKYATGNASTNRVGYVSFDVSSLDLQAMTEASFTLTGAIFNNPTNTNFSFALFGVNDGVANENFIEGTGAANASDGSITWANAPGGLSSTLLQPVTGNMYGGAALATASVLNAVSSEGTTMTFSSASLLNFIKADTNGVVTFAISGLTSNGNANPQFASDEHATLTGPRLTLVPEVSSSLLGAIAFASGLLRRKRRQG